MSDVSCKQARPRPSRVFGRGVRTCRRVPITRFNRHLSRHPGLSCQPCPCCMKRTPHHGVMLQRLGCDMNLPQPLKRVPSGAKASPSETQGITRKRRLIHKRSHRDAAPARSRSQLPPLRCLDSLITCTRTQGINASHRSWSVVMEPWLHRNGVFLLSGLS